MLRTTLTLLPIALAAAVACAQGIKPPPERVGIVYNKETTFNLKITTNRGIAPSMEFGRLRTYYKTKYWHIGLGELKHPKEQRQSADPRVNRSFRPFVYGKQNSLFVARGGWGTKRYFSEKAKQKGVAVGMSYSFGPSLGLLKPYYLALSYSSDLPGNSRVLHQKYSEANAAVFLDNTRVLGASPFTRGLGELSLLPGGNASIAYHMDWGAFDEMVKALEIGLMADIFVKKAAILVSDYNQQVFFNFFVNLQFGKRR
jgi:hypothetical protein